VRPWQHVLEPLSGYLSLAAALLEGAVTAGGETGLGAGAWNFGPGADCLVTVREVVETAVREWGAGGWRPAQEAAEQPHEAGLLLLDPGKAERELGWRPAWSVEEALAASMRWYKEFADGATAERLRDLCGDDIAWYCAAARRAGASWAGAKDAS